MMIPVLVLHMMIGLSFQDCLDADGVWRKPDYISHIIGCAHEMCMSSGIWEPNADLISPQCKKCRVFNDPHFLALNGAQFDWHGHCNYALLQDNDSQDPKFGVFMKFKKSGDPAITLVAEQTVYKENKNIEVKLTHGICEVIVKRKAGPEKVNQITKTPQFLYSDRGMTTVRGWESGGNIKVYGKSKILIELGEHSIHIWARPKDPWYRHKLMGLCGKNTIGGLKGKDIFDRKNVKYADPGYLVTAPETFGLSWKTKLVDQPDPDSTDCEKPDTRSMKNSLKKKQAEKHHTFCANVINHSPYENQCRKIFEDDEHTPEDEKNYFIKTCMFDHCIAVNDTEVNFTQEDMFHHYEKLSARTKIHIENTKNAVGYPRSRLDKLACIILHGRCRPLDDICDGQLEQGPEWCLHSRHFGCCIPRSCSLNGVIYRNGAKAADRCIELVCENGDWMYYGQNTFCGVCYAVGTTNIMPYINQLYNISDWEGAFVFSQYGFLRDAPFGIDITLVSIGPFENCIECILYFEAGVTVEICFNPYDTYPLVCVNEWCFGPIPQFGIAVIIHPGSVYIMFMPYGIYVLGSQGLTVYVDWDPVNPWCPLTVYAFALPYLYDELYGLCGVWHPVPPYPTDYRTFNEGSTTNINTFIGSWQHRLRRKLHKKDQPIIERSMSDIEKLCEEMIKGPCKILSSGECEKLMENCVSRISNVSKPGHGGFIDSSE